VDAEIVLDQNDGLGSAAIEVPQNWVPGRKIGSAICQKRVEKTDDFRFGRPKNRYYNL
jgi:hypothetical protein